MLSSTRISICQVRELYKKTRIDTLYSIPHKLLVMGKKIVLGIETSCDETAIGIVDSSGHILANCLYSQIQEHREFGGVVPELAARAHLARLERLLEQSFKKAAITWSNIDAISVTGGPGLIGGIIVGVMAAKAMAAYQNKPFYAINHLEGHALSPRLTQDISFPYLLLLVSGGHTQFLVVHDVGCYTCLGSTLDDAIGEAFDKTAKLMGLPYPGGPLIEQLALNGNPLAYTLPKPLIKQKNCTFSLSGLKTAVRQCLEKNNISKESLEAADLCASFQYTVTELIKNRLFYALEAAHSNLGKPVENFVVAGGVSANKYIRSSLKDFCQSKGLHFYAPDLKLCTDNGAMIAWAGVERIRAGLHPDTLSFPPRPRWPLDALKLEIHND